MFSVRNFASPDSTSAMAQASSFLSICRRETAARCPKMNERTILCTGRQGSSPAASVTC